ncbi:MAG: hypothetical protein ABJB12_02165 [Pseudomonadota bacterium]
MTRISLCLALLLSIAGCTNGGARFTTRLASDFAPAHHTVSVLGVYQDGRMALGTWDTVAPYLKRALGPAQCAVLYDTLATSDQDLANAIDELARDEGPTGNLLATVAPAASGDLILVLTFAGKVPQHRNEDPGPPTGAPVQNGMAQSRRRHGQRGSTPEGRDPNQLDISASLYSVAQARPVALVSMQYRGESVGDALSRFAQELAAATPDLKCTGWNRGVKIDASKLRPPLEIPSEAHAE